MSDSEQRRDRERDRLEKIIERLLDIIENLLNQNQKITVSAKGELMPARILVGGKGATFKFTEFAADGVTIVKPTGPIQFQSDTPAVATVDNASQVVNPDGSVSVQVAAVAANADGTDATAVISGLDTANQLAAADKLTVGAAVVQGAVSATGVLTAN